MWRVKIQIFVKCHERAAMSKPVANETCSSNFRCLYFHPVTGPFMKYKTWMFEWMEAHFRSWVRHGILYIYIGIVHITRLIPGVCTYLHPVTGDRSGRLLTNPELSLLPPHLPVWWPVHETCFQNNFILRVELTCNNRVILLQWAAVWRCTCVRKLHSSSVCWLDWQLITACTDSQQQLRCLGPWMEFAKSIGWRDFQWQYT